MLSARIWFAHAYWSLGSQTVLAKTINNTAKPAASIKPANSSQNFFDFNRER